MRGLSAVWRWTPVKARPKAGVGLSPRGRPIVRTFCQSNWGYSHAVGHPGAHETGTVGDRSDPQHPPHTGPCGAAAGCSPRDRADIARSLAAEESKRLRQAEIVADPACADPEDPSPHLIDKVMSARFGYGIAGEMEIAGLPCHRTLSQAAGLQSDRLRAEGALACWWMDARGNLQGDRA